jgi:hypothetical protein
MSSTRDAVVDAFGEFFGMALGGVVGVAIVGGGVALVGRVIYWLIRGIWLSSACDISWVLPMKERARETWVAVGCHTFDTSWIGLNSLLNWWFGLDVTLFLLLTGAVIFGVGFVAMMAIGAALAK